MGGGNTRRRGNSGGAGILKRAWCSPYAANGFAFVHIGVVVAAYYLYPKTPLIPNNVAIIISSIVIPYSDGLYTVHG